METLTLSQYFCEVLMKSVPEKCDEEIYLRLLLNCFHFLCKGQKHELLIKSVFELRLTCIAGYMPSLIACNECSEYETEEMYFNCADGSLLCEACGRGMAVPRVSKAVISAMRHIAFSEFSKIFSFELNEPSLEVLNRLTESYLKSVFGQDFRLLDYLRVIKN